jgi:hypothetical protein
MTMSPLARQVLHILTMDRPDGGFAWAPGAGPEQPCPIHGVPGPMTGGLLRSRLWWSGAEVQRMVDESEERVRSALNALVRGGLAESWETSKDDRAACRCLRPEHPYGTLPEVGGRSPAMRYRLSPAGCDTVSASTRPDRPPV